MTTGADSSSTSRENARDDTCASRTRHISSGGAWLLDEGEVGAGEARTVPMVDDNGTVSEESAQTRLSRGVEVMERLVEVLLHARGGESAELAAEVSWLAGLRLSVIAWGCLATTEGIKVVLGWSAATICWDWIDVEVVCCCCC